MIDPNLYVDREQTYVKHVVLKNYLERVAYNIFSFQDNFVYVDGFSGPWKSVGQDYEDTSFKISLGQLREVREGVKKGPKKDVSFRCLFIEKGSSAFKELQNVVEGIKDVEIQIINGAFESHIKDICEFIGHDFSLVFIDPTGWQGFPMKKIQPLLKMKGEVLINFMFDYINRFIDDPRPEIASSFDSLFGADWYQEWKKLVASGLSREAAVVDVYTSRIKETGGFNYVTSTRILKPQSDRSYFYLIYATRHWKGIQEFRKVEEKAIKIQENIRQIVKLKTKSEKTGQGILFGLETLAELSAKSYEEEKKSQMVRGHNRLYNLLQKHKQGIEYQEVLGEVLQTPLFWKSDLDDWLQELKKDNKIIIQGMTPRERVPKSKHIIQLK